MSQRYKMRKALDQYVVPCIISEGFTGKYPHYRRISENKIDLLSFQTNKWGNSFTVEVSYVFIGVNSEESNFVFINEGEIRKYVKKEDLDTINVWYTGNRFRLKGMFDGWFYYTDVFSHFSFLFFSWNYDAISETRMKTYRRKWYQRHIWISDSTIYKRVCDKVNGQLPEAYKWLAKQK